ncbi:hypothetical protein MCC93_19950 [Morococcus cerebrosus]|uniref:Uncharacterized protein n=1 Tax=Morococcus cerebrosus TaxID=1056807 RepID=A0A0C1GMA7_9NEIS|nr:hypothetical protein MCC93_19950 [Morococcus cerebrosus]
MHVPNLSYIKHNSKLSFPLFTEYIPCLLPEKEKNPHRQFSDDLFQFTV